MKDILEQKVYHSDTDTYGVVWHGSYLRWMEMGRVEFCEKTGMTLKELANLDILLPVAEVNLKYKSSAKLEDIVLIETSVEKFNGLSATFNQIIKSKETGKIFVEGHVTVVSVDHNGKLYRKMPVVLSQLFEKALSTETPVCA